MFLSTAPRPAGRWPSSSPTRTTRAIGPAVVSRAVSPSLGNSASAARPCAPPSRRFGKRASTGPPPPIRAGRETAPARASVKAVSAPAGEGGVAHERVLAPLIAEEPARAMARMEAHLVAEREDPLADGAGELLEVAAG